jgi:elongation factor 4
MRVTAALRLANSVRTQTKYIRGFATDRQIDTSAFTPALLRNFCIVAHIDHGKSTLADRLLEITGTTTIQKDQYLDKLTVERERGITVKAQTATLFHPMRGQRYMLNLIDTPGHVDFSYEVSRSLVACDGVILLVDAEQGVQAQTIANWKLVQQHSLSVIPVLNKIDRPNADVDKCCSQLQNGFGIAPKDVLKISAKTGVGVPELLTEIVLRVPPPPVVIDAPLRALLFDSWFDAYRGVICLVVLKSGALTRGRKLWSLSSGRGYEVMQCGLMHPEPTETDSLFAGQVGYVILGMKASKEAVMGDTFAELADAEPLTAIQPARSMVWAGLYPADTQDLPKLRTSIEKLCLTDASVSINNEMSDALGQGFRCGFLGMLHLDVFQQRLRDEYEAEVIMTAPTVPYKAVLKSDGSEAVVRIPTDLPAASDVLRYLEPIIVGTIVTPADTVSAVMTLCQDRRGRQRELVYVDEAGTTVTMVYELPLAEVVSDFFDQLKSQTHGMASFDYEDAGYQEADLVCVRVLLNGESVDALAFVSHESKAENKAKAIVAKLKELIERQQFPIAIQGSIRNKVIARETIPAFRKNVLERSGKLVGGGDKSRKMKLLEKQKEGKKRMKTIGRVQLSQEAFLSVLK